MSYFVYFIYTVFPLFLLWGIKTERDNEKETSTPAVSQTADIQREGDILPLW